MKRPDNCKDPIACRVLYKVYSKLIRHRDYDHEIWGRCWELRLDNLFVCLVWEEEINKIYSKESVSKGRCIISDDVFRHV